MLRITIKSQSPRQVELSVEGRLVPKWNEELERECRRHQIEGKRVVLDLGGVSFVDRQGLRSLKRILSADISVVNWPPLVQSLFLDEQRK